jgi:hypothetical protein
VTDEYLTVAEAAGRLGVGEKRLRRWLAKPENEGLTIASVRMRKTGPINVAVLPAAILGTIAEQLRPAPRDPQESDTGTTRTEQGQNRPKGGTPNGDNLLLETLQARVDDLQAALESERQNSARIAESLALVRDILKENQEEVRQLRALAAPERKAAWWQWRR